MKRKSICSMLIVILLVQLILPVISAIRVLAVEIDNREELIIDTVNTKLETNLETIKFGFYSSENEKIEKKTIPKLENSVLIETYDISATENDNVTASLYKVDGNYMIVISGTGKMKDFAKASEVPWNSYCGPYSSNLTKVVIEEGVENVGNYSFATQYGLKKLELSNTVTSIGSNAFTWCKFTDLVMPNSIVSLGKSAFLGCSIENLKLSNNLKKISAEAFYDVGITELEIPSSVEVIGDSAFYSCNGLTYVYIPENVKTIESQAFTNCSSLTFVEIASGVTSIGSQAFSGCENLTKITIPSNVQTIGLTTGDYWNIVDDSENVTVYFKSGSVAQEYFAAFDKTTVVDDNNPIITNVEISETDWTNKDVTITVTANDELSGLSKYAYSFDGGETWQEENYKTYRQYTEGIVIKVKDCLYNTETYGEEITVYIDKVNPEITNVEISKTDWTNQDVTVTVNATDDLSRFGAESYSFDGGATWQEENFETYEENTTGIKVIIKDKAGNIVEYPEIINITNIDKVAPSIRLVSGEREACLSTTIIVNATDDLSGFGAKSYSFDNGVTWQGSNKKEYTESAENVIIQVRDQVGNTVTYQEGINIVIGHNEVIDRAVEATCIKDGLTEGSHCLRCEKILIAQQVLDALGHEEVIDDAVEATCTKAGLTQGKHCSRCDEVLVAQEVVDALRHDYKIKSKDEAVCEQGGKIVYECSRCNDSYEETIEPTGHTVVTDSAVDATCTETGLTEGSHCSKCKEILVEQQVIDALGHNHETVVTDATCTEKGYTTHSCTRCDDEYVDTYTDALGHDYKIKFKDEAVCEQGGKIVYECSRCNDSYEETIEPTGHTVVTDSAVDATCTETGLTEGSHCSVCNTVLVAQQVVNALGHNFGAWVIDKEATYEEEGHKYRICVNCNEEREGEIIPKLTKEEIQITTTYDVKEIENNKYITLTESSKLIDIINNITSNSDIEIEDKDGNVLDENSKVGTGAKVITKEDQKVQYTVVLQGDVNSDGEITFKDIIRTNAIRINNGENDIIKAQLLAADINNTNKIEFRDIILLNAIRINAIKN